MTRVTGQRMNAVLRVLGFARYPQTAAQIASELRWPEPAALRALMDCEDRGFVRTRAPGDRWERCA